MAQEATQVGRIIIPTERAAKPGGPRDHEEQRAAHPDPKWHGVAILYVRRVNETVELRLFYEGHIPQNVKDEIAQRFGVGAIEWDVCG